MKIAIVYESICGNTAAVAQAIAEGLRPLGDVDVRAVGDESFDAAMLVVGAPTHVHGLPSSKIRKAIEAAAEDAAAKGNPLDYQPTACGSSHPFGPDADRTLSAPGARRSSRGRPRRTSPEAGHRRPQ